MIWLPVGTSKHKNGQLLFLNLIGKYKIVFIKKSSFN